MESAAHLDVMKIDAQDFLPAWRSPSSPVGFSPRVTLRSFSCYMLSSPTRLVLAHFPFTCTATITGPTTATITSTTNQGHTLDRTGHVIDHDATPQKHNWFLGATLA